MFIAILGKNLRKNAKEFMKWGDNLSIAIF